MKLHEHEKFFAFMALGFGVMLLAGLAIAYPVESDGTQRVIDAAMGALSLALGAATNALFRIGDKVEIKQPEGAEPIPVTETPHSEPKVADGELPETEKLP